MRFVIELDADLPDDLTSEAKTEAVRAVAKAAGQELQAAGGRIWTFRLRGGGASLSSLDPAEEAALLGTPGVRDALDGALAGKPDDLVSRGSFAGYANQP